MRHDLLGRGTQGRRRLETGTIKQAVRTRSADTEQVLEACGFNLSMRHTTKMDFTVIPKSRWKNLRSYLTQETGNVTAEFQLEENKDAEPLE